MPAIESEAVPSGNFDLMEKAYPDLIKKLGLKRISPDDILPSPSLF